jgi:hypothetical protein
MPTPKKVKPTMPDGTRVLNFEIADDEFIVENNGDRLAVSLRCPSIRIGDRLYGTPVRRLAIRGDISSGKPGEVVFEPVPIGDKASLEVRLFIQWFPAEKVLRKWANMKLKGDSSPIPLSEVILDRLNLTPEMGVAFNPAPSYGIKPGQSYPAFFKSFFAGIEFPVASTRLEDGKLVLAHRPGLKLAVDQWYETRKAVYGICPEAQEKSTFFEYLALHHATRHQFHVNYNNWWTSPIQYTENDILGLMQVLKENLYDRYRASFDSFCFDMGWSNDRSIWEIDDRLFPEGFSRLSDLAAKMESGLGLWVSPGACYDAALNNAWAKDHGYEAATAIFPEFNDLEIVYLCLGGDKYRNEFLENIVNLVKTYKIQQVKLDGHMLECTEESHGHAPGEYSSEAIATGTIAVLNAIRQAEPEVWLEATCFGWNPSPWWLYFVDSLIGAYGTDAPCGRVPCPVFRESYTSARDFYNLQGVVRIPIPISAQEVLGIIHQTPDCFMNDAVMTVMRGHSFLPVYLNPKYMNETRWEKFAGLLRWVKTHPSIVKKTEALLPVSWMHGRCPQFTNEASMPREPYGYAHWNIEPGKSLVVLRNPWIKPCTYALKLPNSLNESMGDQSLEIVSLYPEARTYGQGLTPGDVIEISLAPYETLVLSIGAKQPDRKVIYKPGKAYPAISVNALKHAVLRTNDIQLDLDISIEVQAPHAEILIILEGESAIPQPTPSMSLDGIESPVLCSSSEDGWTASTLPAVEHWLILQAPIPGGKHEIHITAAFSQSVRQLSAWAWATKPGQRIPVDDLEIIPQPEQISQDALVLIEPFGIGPPSRRDGS